MKKIAPVAAVVVLASALAVLVYYATRPPKENDQPIDNTAVTPRNETFDKDTLMLVFDENGDKQITFEEFDARYGKAEGDDPGLVYHTADGTAALSATDAFKRWDINHDGLISADDIRIIDDKEWLKNAMELEKLGLHPFDWKGKLLGLNDHQKRTIEAEKGAEARGEFPFAGAFWAKTYFAGRWAHVTDPKAGEVNGYVIEKNGKSYVLTDKAELLVKNPAKVEISLFADDDPHMLYAAEIVKLKFDDTPGNLALAKKARDWGLKVEAGMLYARVLIFDRANQEALDALGYKLEGYKFVSKE